MAGLDRTGSSAEGEMVDRNVAKVFQSLMGLLGRPQQVSWLLCPPSI